MAYSFSKASLHKWRFALCVLVVSLLIELTGDTGRAALRYENTLLPSGEIWRAVTGHFTHLGWGHFILNGAGLMGVWWIYGNQFRARSWAVVFLICSAGISAGFLLLDKDLSYYVGLSGVLHGVLSAGVLYSILKANGRIAWEDGVIFAGLCAKVGYEQFNGAVPLTEGLAGSTVIVNAHFYGAVIGGLCAAMGTYYSALCQQSQKTTCARGENG